MKEADLKRLNRARAERRAAVVVTPLAGGAPRLVTREEAADDPLAEPILAQLAKGTSGRVTTPDGDVFLRVHRPAPRLTIIGAVHVSQALAPMAITCGFDVTIVDPRTAFATPERFADLNLVPEWPDADLLALDGETAVATLTHDPKIDDPALLAALQADCFYIGALGSKKTHAKRVERLTAAGISQAEMARIHAPIGLPIGAASPQEIAVAVLAEVITALRRGERPAVPAKAAAVEPA